jgi:predicted ATP-grasp superfamily ATP-dependent carboligase
MPLAHLTTLSAPRMRDATLLLALSGWMDGGLVSTGTVRRMMDGRELLDVARIEPDPFYIYNFPGSMEVAALFRPEVKYEDGLVTEFDIPTNLFQADVPANILFFTGKEPNLLWQAFADCIFSVAHDAGVKRIIFIGSFGGSVPHTREPRMYGSVSHAHLKPQLHDFGIRLSDYEGPGSFSTLLLHQAPAHDVEMLSLVAEIPGYLQGLNPMSIEAVTRRLARIINQGVNLDSLRRASDEWEQQVTLAVEKDAELAETVRKLEERYDNDLIGAANPEEEEERHEMEEGSEDEE